MAQNSSINTGAVSISNVAAIPVITWFLAQVTPGMQYPPEVLYAISAAAVTVAHVAYNIARVKSWLITEVPTTTKE